MNDKDIKQLFEKAFDSYYKARENKDNDRACNLFKEISRLVLKYSKKEEFKKYVDEYNSLLE